jgi:hypothetical protein
MELQRNFISMNEAGERLFADDRFTTSGARYSVTTVELNVAGLGFPCGATTAEFDERMTVLGLGHWPLELALHLRLQYLDQPEGDGGMPVRQHRAPYGSITIASDKITEEDDFPKGFYLRRINRVLWLRGYRCGPEHVGAPDDYFIFGKREGAAYDSRLSS